MKDANLIKVGAVFKGSTIIPKWFIWEGRKYNVKSIDYTWEDRQGEEKLVMFAVSDGTNTYELAYNAVRMNWTLGKVC